MVKKGTKRKTRWRTLSIGEGATDDISDIGVVDHCSLKEQKENLPITSHTKHVSNGPHGKSMINDVSKGIIHQISRSEHHPRHFYKNSDKIPLSKPHNSTSSYTLYKRRTSSYNQSASTKYRSTAGDRSYTRSADTSSTTKTTINTTTNINNNNNDNNNCDKDTSATKPLFNEDEYTRITTPRQDVLFKKGYLSRPKKIPTVTNSDLKILSSGAMSVTSTEESMSSSTTTQSASPEYLNSTPELNDSEQQPPYFYSGFFDQNGVFFMNPYLTNGFDTYGGQLIMMPYEGPPYSINPAEYYGHETTLSPYALTQNQQKRSSIDSQNTPTTTSSQDEPTSLSTNSPPVTEHSDSGEMTTVDSPSVTTKNDEISSEITEMPIEMIPEHCSHPQLFYPFMYGPPPQFLPITGLGYNEHNTGGYGAAPYNRFNRFKKRKRPIYKNNSNSTGVSATTTDYSDDDDSTDNDQLNTQPRQHSDDGYESNITPTLHENILSHTTLNTNVSEFIPRRMQSTTLNVDVAEFHPRNYKTSITESIENEENVTPPLTLPSHGPHTETDNEKQPECGKLQIQQDSTNRSSIISKSIRSKTKCMLRSSNSRNSRISNKIAEKAAIDDDDDDVKVKADLVYKLNTTSPRYKNKNIVQGNNGVKNKPLKLIMPKKFTDQNKSIVVNRLTSNELMNDLKKQINEKSTFKSIEPINNEEKRQEKHETKEEFIEKKHENNQIIDLKIKSLNHSINLNKTASVTNSEKKSEKLNNSINQKINKKRITKLVKDTGNTDKKEKAINVTSPESNQVTYAQMVAPIKLNSPETKSNIEKQKYSNKKDMIENQQEIIDIHRAIKESQKNPNEQSTTAWQTVKQKGRKKQYVKCEMQNGLFDNESVVEDEKNTNEILIMPIEKLIENNEPENIVENNTIENVPELECSHDNEEIVKINQTKLKTNKKEKQEKLKKQKQKIPPKKNNVKDSSITTEQNNLIGIQSISTPKKQNNKNPSNTNKSLNFIDEIIQNCDISNFNFDNSSLLMNPMQTSHSIFATDKITKNNNISGHTTGFGMNNGLMLMNKYDFNNSKMNKELLKEEEEMVMEVMKNLKQNQPINDHLLKMDQKLPNKSTKLSNSQFVNELKLNETNEKNTNDHDDVENDEDLFFKIVEEMNIKFIEKNPTNQFDRPILVDNGDNNNLQKFRDNELNERDVKNETITEKIKMLIEDEVCNSSNIKLTSNQSNNHLKLDSFYTNMGNMFKQIKSFDIATTNATTNDKNSQQNGANSKQPIYVDRTDDLQLSNGYNSNNGKIIIEQNNIHLDNNNHNKLINTSNETVSLNEINLIKPLNDNLINKNDQEFIIDQCVGMKNECDKQLNKMNELNEIEMVEKMCVNEITMFKPNHKNENENQLSNIIDNNQWIKMDEKNTEFISQNTINNTSNHQHQQYIFNGKQFTDCSAIHNEMIEFIPIIMAHTPNECEQSEILFLNDYECSDEYGFENDEENVNEHSDTEEYASSEISSEDDGENTVINKLIDRNFIDVNDNDHTEQYCDTEIEPDDHCDYDNFMINTSTNTNNNQANENNKIDEHFNDECNLNGQIVPHHIQFEELFMQKLLLTKRTQSPRHSEDSGILEYCENIDDGKYCSDTENEIRITSKKIIDGIKFPITEAVSKWLVEKQKEKSPEPLLRLPTDPQLNQQIERSIMKQFNIIDYFPIGDGISSDDSEIEYEFKIPQKLPHATEMVLKKIERNSMESDNMSDENVPSLIFDEPDMLECWEIDDSIGINDENYQHPNKNPTINNKIMNEIESYESVYGQTINYKKILENKNEFLSNNILYNDQSNNAKDNSRFTNKSQLNINDDNVTDKTNTNTNTNSNTNNNNFSNSTTTITTNQSATTTNKDDLRNLNYVKPPEICCILM